MSKKARKKEDEMMVTKKEDEMMAKEERRWNDGSSGCWPAFTVFTLLLLDNTRCSLENLQSDDTYQSMQDPKIAWKYVLKRPKPPKLL